MALRDFIKDGRPRLGQWVHVDGSAYGLENGSRVLGIIAGDITLQHRRKSNVQGIATHVLEHIPPARYLRRLRQGGVITKAQLDQLTPDQIATILQEFEGADTQAREILSGNGEDKRERLVEILTKCMLIPVGWEYHVDIVDPEKGTTIDSWACHVEHLMPVVGPRRKAGDHPFEALPRDRAVSEKAVLRP